MSKIVKGVGPNNAKIAIIGEAPGRTEERLGKPFVGSAGYILDAMLDEAGIRREDCYIDNVMQTRPANNKFSQFSSTDVAEGRKRLCETLRAIKPNITIALGNHALEALTGRKSISIWRGSLLQGKEGKVLGTFHPAYIMRQWSDRPLAVLDLRRAKEESDTPELNLPQPKFVLNPSLDESLVLLEEAKKAEYLSFDLETTRGGRPTCIGFSTECHSAFCIPFMFNGVPAWNEHDELMLWKAIASLIADPGPKKIAQNVMFDAYVLHSVLNIDIANFWMDTMLMHALIYSELPKGLDTLCSIYTRYPYYKNMARVTKTKEGLWEYNSLDACVTLECALALTKEAEEFGVWRYYKSHINPLIWPLLQMQSRGVKVNIAKREAAAKEMLETIDTLNGALEEAAGGPVNVASPIQVRKLLYETLGLPKKYARGTKNLTTNAKALKELAKKHDHPALHLILKIRDLRKLHGTYMTNPIDPDGRMRCTYNIAGTRTGRISSSQTIWGSGGNLQNVPHGIAREVIEADSGKIFLHADLSQAEARVVGYLAQDDAMIRIFESGKDMHSQMSMMLFGTDEQRQMTKKLVHATNYSMGPRTFAQNAGVSEREAYALLDRYHTTFPRVRVWHMQVQSELRRTRMLHTPTGRKRMFFGRWGDPLFREAYAYIPQTTVADVLNSALVNLYYASPPNVEFLLHIHDAIMIQFPVGDEEFVEKAISFAFDVPIKINGRTFRIPYKASTGDNWEEASK